MNTLFREWNLDDYTEVRAEERAEKKAEKIAEKMIKRGTPLDIVAEDTELSMRQIEKIINKINKNQ